LRNRCVRQLLCSRVRIRADAPSQHFADPASLHFGYVEARAAPLDALANCRYPVEEKYNKTAKRVEVGVRGVLL
jgi:hypothetical protein